VHVLRVDARGVAGVRIPVGVAVLAVEQEEKLVTVGDDVGQ